MHLDTVLYQRLCACTVQYVCLCVISNAASRPDYHNHNIKKPPLKSSSVVFLLGKVIYCVVIGAIVFNVTGLGKKRVIAGDCRRLPTSAYITKPTLEWDNRAALGKLHCYLLTGWRAGLPRSNVFDLVSGGFYWILDKSYFVQ